jgi:hypothetical protein
MRGSHDVAHAGVEREAGDGLEAKGQEGQEVDERRQRIVAGGDFAVHLDLQHVGLDDVDNFLPLLFGDREEVVPLGVLVADKSPVDAGQQS